MVNSVCRLNAWRLYLWGIFTAAEDCAKHGVSCSFPLKILSFANWIV
ncbi:MAG: hypothetical protein SPL70_07675 [Cyanobacteriota bacterium]|nr:hypothetical protein [Cyanobacteriota bacterium]MDY6358769.1 hypothetical protein [Cyanobacteriota bacterium]MDY6383761.1 hypothetical protein [Cyanobacteriota bacterium]